jgi:hypothetical protein
VQENADEDETLRVRGPDYRRSRQFEVLLYFPMEVKDFCSCSGWSRIGDEGLFYISRYGWAVMSFFASEKTLFAMRSITSYTASISDIAFRVESGAPEIAKGSPVR